MRKQGGGFGVVMLLVVVAIVLYLATQAFKNSVPTASELREPASSSAEAKGAAVSGEVPPVRPSLREMKQETDSHVSDVTSTLEEAQ